MRTATITLTFRVVGEKLLRERAERAIADFGAGHETDGSSADLIVEVLLHSNPAVDAYLDYGIELTSQELSA